MTLDPTPPVESARRHIALMGGRDRVLSEAKQAMDAGDAQWAAELSTYLIRVNHEDRDARAVKAAAFRKLGYASINTNWRNWYLASAHELDGTLDTGAVTARARANFGSPETIAGAPRRGALGRRSDHAPQSRRHPEHRCPTMVFRFRTSRNPTAWKCGAGSRRSMIAPPEEHADVSIEMDKKTLDQWLLGRSTLVRGLNSGGIKVTTGTRADVLKFFEYFEPWRAIPSC